MELKEGQWYALPSGRWSRATRQLTVQQRRTTGWSSLLWLLQVYGLRNGSWVEDGTINVAVDGTLNTHDTSSALPWTVSQLREATLDEAAELTQRCWT